MKGDEGDKASKHPASGNGGKNYGGDQEGKEGRKLRPWSLQCSMYVFLQVCPTKPQERNTPDKDEDPTWPESDQVDVVDPSPCDQGNCQLC